MSHVFVRSIAARLAFVLALLAPGARYVAAQGTPARTGLVVDSAAGTVERVGRDSAPAATPAVAADVGTAPAAAPHAATPPRGETAADSVRQVARWLEANGAPAHRAQALAPSVLRFARLRGLDPLLVVGVIGVENARLAPRARSRAGARGVMQVMPSWKQDIRGCGSDMHDPHVNVCFGTAVLRIAMDASTSVREALLRYNGCVRAPGCTQYASAVFGRAGHAVLMSRLSAHPLRRETVATASATTAGAAPTGAPTVRASFGAAKASAARSSARGMEDAARGAVAAPARPAAAAVVDGR